MTSISNPEPSPSTALVPYVPPQSQAIAKSHLERIVDAVYKHSLEVAKFETRALSPPNRDSSTTMREAGSRRLYQIMPVLTGPHSLGYTRFVIEGPKKTRSVGDSRIGIEVYVPTKRGTGSRVPLAEFPAGHLEKIGLNFEQIQTLRTHSHDQIDPIEKARSIIIFSHGLGVPPLEYRLLLEELTSHGYLVLSLNHPSSSGYAPFGEEAPPNKAALNDPARCDEELERLTSLQTDNIQYVVDLIRDSEALGTTTQLTDPIVLAGHSIGGAASIIAARNDPRIAGCIDLDGSLKGNKEKRTAELAAPTLIISADHKQIPKQVTQDFESFFKSSSAFSYKIDGINHMDFCFFPISKWLGGEDTLAGALQAHRVASRVMLRFMNSIPI